MYVNCLPCRDATRVWKPAVNSAGTDAAGADNKKNLLPQELKDTGNEIIHFYTSKKEGYIHENRNTNSK